MIHQVLALGSVAALLISVFQVWWLARGAPRQERPLLWGAGFVLLLGMTQRAVLGAQVLLAENPAFSLRIEFALFAGTATINVLLYAMRPVLFAYRRADQLRQASEDVFYHALDDSRDPIALIDRTGTYVYVNDAGCSFFRYPREEIIGHHFRETLVDRAPVPRGAVERATNSGAAIVQREVRRGDGTNVPVECDLISLGDGRILILGRDLTFRHDAEAMRLRAARLATTRELTATIGYDLKDALTFVKSSLELTEELGAQRVPLDGPVEASSAALELMEEFIALSAAPAEQSGDLPSISTQLAEVVQHEATSIARQLDPRVRLQLGDLSNEVRVDADPAETKRLVARLFEHARGAIEESLAASGTTPTATREIDTTLGWAEQLDGEGRRLAELVVRYTGSVLTPEMRGISFQPFDNANGSDVSRRLGLAIVHALVLRLGGDMTVQRDINGGTTLTVRLPSAA